MKIRLIFSTEKIQDNQKTLYRAGETVDVDDDTAKQLIKEGRAEIARAKARPEDTPPQ